jgi:hypothetical protein
MSCLLLAILPLAILVSGVAAQTAQVTVKSI